MQVTIHAKIIITNTDGKLLLLKRSYGNKTRDLPGGAITLPETVEEWLLRELQEETWITHVHSLKVVECISSYNNDEDNYVVFIWYTWTTPEHAVHVSEEHEEYMRATKEEVYTLWVTPYLKDFIDKCYN